MSNKKARIDVYSMQLIIISVFLLMLIVFLSVSSKFFLTGGNLVNLIRQSAFTILVGCAATFVVIQGNIDLSVGSVLAFCCVIYAMICKATGSIWLATLVCLCCGTLVGAVNAFFSVKLGILPIITTMSTMNIMRGLAFIICDAKSITSGGQFPDNYSFLGRGNLFGFVPIPLIMILIVYAIFSFVEKRTVIGKYSLAIGSNKTAAMLAGINAKKIQTIAFCLTGAMAGLAGALMSSRVGIGEPKTGYDFEFDVMIAIILGGTSMKGGEGKLIGTVIGALVVAMLDNGMDLMGVYSFYQYIVKGVVLVFFVIVLELIKRRYKRN